jgi:hypothetical protein
MIPFKNQNKILEEVVRGLTAQDSRLNYNIVAPPGFLDQKNFAAAVVEHLADAAPEMPAGAVSTDSLKDMDAYAESLASQWGFGSGSGEANMDSLLAGLKRSAPAIQVICYFEKIVNQFDDAILGKLRDAEGDGALKSLTVSYYSYNKLRDRWREENRVFCCSNYGDTHDLVVLEPATFEEVEAAMQDSGVDSGILRQLYGMAGGFPYALQIAIERWKHLQPKQLDPETRRRVTKPLETIFERCCDWLDTPPSNRWQEILAGCVVGEDREQRLIQASTHQWFRVLFHEDSIRSQALISALMRAWARRILNIEGESQKAVEALHRNKQYSRLESALKAQGDSIPPHLILVRFHSAIMARLFESRECESEEQAYKEAKESLMKAKQFVRSGLLRLASEDSEFLLQRYEELSSFVEHILKACKKDSNRRIVDVLIDVREDNALAAALLLLDERISSAERTLNHSDAIQLAVPLPEQILRVWARLALEVNYYSAPSLDRESFADAAMAAAEMRNIELRNVGEGQRFPELFTFSFYCIALALRRQLPQGQMPADNLKELSSLLGETVDPRNSSGHAVVFATQKTRSKYFEVIKRWKKCLHDVASEKINTDASGLLEPLPLVDASGNVLW